MFTPNDRQLCTCMHFFLIYNATTFFRFNAPRKKIYQESSVFFLFPSPRLFLSSDDNMLIRAIVSVQLHTWECAMNNRFEVIGRVGVTTGRESRVRLAKGECLAVFLSMSKKSARSSAGTSRVQVVCAELSANSSPGSAGCSAKKQRRQRRASRTGGETTM